MIKLLFSETLEAGPAVLNLAFESDLGGLFQDTEYPGRFVENFIVESWAEHLRQHDRVTHMDKTIQEKVRSFHVGQSRLKATHYLNVF